MINVSLYDLLSLVSSAVSAGVQDYIKGTNPDQDRVKQADAKRFLKSRGFQPVMLRKWCDAGLLHPKKNGETQNCATIYSLAEIKKVISAIELKRICNN
jgi:hypothetical protein|nr:MAG TPA: chaperone-modulator protein [Caudoviricetes sp.]